MVKKRLNQDHVKDKKVRLYVEGGGDTDALRTACREGFANFLSKAGLKGHMPRIVACGSRGEAFKDFCTALKIGQRAFLLIDSEAPVATQTGAENSTLADRRQWQAWAHLKQRPGDEWDQPKQAKDTDCHLMVQIMESWFLADSKTLATFFGTGFDQSKLPSISLGVETIAKQLVYKALDQATAHCKTKASYGKGEHSFKILAAIDPEKVCAASPWAQRLVEVLKQEMGVK